MAMHWRQWRSRRRMVRSQQLLATGAGVRMMSASLTSFDRDPMALGWLGGGQFFSGPASASETGRPPLIPTRL